MPGIAGHSIILSISRSRIRRYLLSQFCSDISYWGFPTTPRHIYFHMRSWLDYATMLCLEYHNAVSPPVWSRSLRAAGMNTNTNTNTRTVCAHKLVKKWVKKGKLDHLVLFNSMSSFQLLPLSNFVPLELLNVNGMWRHYKMWITDIWICFISTAQQCS